MSESTKGVSRLPVALVRVIAAAQREGWDADVSYDGPHLIEVRYTLRNALGKVRQHYRAVYARQGNVWKLHHATEVIWYGRPIETSRSVTKAELHAALRGT